MERAAVDLDVLVGRLEGELGTAAVRVAPGGLADHAVDGMAPSVRCAPADAAQVAAVLRLCGEAGAAVIPRGGGTALHWGNPPRRADVVLSLERLDRLVEHDDANLTATVQAGMPVTTCQQVLARAGQFLPVDPPHPSRATVGGVVAVGGGGPRRMLYGGVRDLVTGMGVVLADGQQIRAGGKVVKNVAGYDMCKLFTGSLGTLGVITDVTFRLAPVPEAEATAVAWGDLPALLALVDDLFASVLQPAAVAVVGPHVAVRAGLAAGPAVAVRAEGFAEAVARHTADVRRMAASRDLRADEVSAEDHRRLWATLADASGGPTPEALFRVAVPLGAVGDVVPAVHAAGAAQWIAHAGSGAVWVEVPAPEAAAWWDRLSGLAAQHGGHCVLAAAPPEAKAGRDVWGPPPPTLGIMRELKRHFDPRGMLNPGRFLGGL
ncbi:MAG: FAD-binding oxidoreductase [Armatimonadota bacterium]|nr:FAD-binding oxidoreductase [Armatimonadota bacterium]MDR7471499.1 FAD-binding oxidoreductase [Armatimonadota bacterium]MDR7506550.1 FAD-binding oxidoreductase [Armatimonadota bacterium]MDR7516403.1 FAD-binding oxidoreductase [Armatimonadota bacterium]MDR7582022.1 FAD-binding oxidoreductase [Armatimonadota bacterium]